VDAAGSAMGSLGLLVFAVITWQFLPAHSAGAVLGAATVVWAVVSVFVWQLRKRGVYSATKAAVRSFARTKSGWLQC
jgi:NAD(P)-dependent dehydrogenase (short-subunit alcohol dehydrogenase family)